ncbi:uncharacterized protein BJ212DRAFT_1295949 [Suillus subaureus]|uniref:AMP-dependent synthetase/ligase domain-containing protein n=1 Tax=Suillus subaureus TaxID=48587 RepID=A0A9P7JJ42_9AGAM|nr:uncharacterized protein BJ212DRAFT_1295949 [Suillus subaureus]KAG1824894.1 hypothetical protein BJ212DRAFT_1295949 [Suillus subaureus]
MEMALQRLMHPQLPCGYPRNRACSSRRWAILRPDVESGGLQIRGPMVSVRYYNNPEATSSSFIEGGWYRTSDISIIENGVMPLSDCIKDTIIHGVSWARNHLQMVEGITHSFLAAAPYRAPGQETEGLIIFYSCLHELFAPYQALRNICVMITLPPQFVIFIHVNQMEKTTLGKLWSGASATVCLSLAEFTYQKSTFLKALEYRSSAASITGDGSRGPYNQIPRSKDFFSCCLQGPDREFRHHFRVSRDTFDWLVAKLADNTIFTSTVALAVDLRGFFADRNFGAIVPARARFAPPLACGGGMNEALVICGVVMIAPARSALSMVNGTECVLFANVDGCRVPAER